MIWKGQNYAISTKTTPFLSVPSVVFTGSLLVHVALKRAGLLAMRCGCKLEDKQLEMLGVTTIGSHSHAGSQVLVEVHHCITWADPDISFGGLWGAEGAAPRSSAAGASIEAPKAPRGCKEGKGRRGRERKKGRLGERKGGAHCLGRSWARPTSM